MFEGEDHWNGLFVPISSGKSTHNIHRKETKVEEIYVQCGTEVVFNKI